MPERLKRFRQKHGITQKQAAESLGIDQQQWSKYEVGRHEFPLRYLEELCKIYNTTPNDILEYNDK